MYTVGNHFGQYKNWNTHFKRGCIYLFLTVSHIYTIIVLVIYTIRFYHYVILWNSLICWRNQLTYSKISYKYTTILCFVSIVHYVENLIGRQIKTCSFVYMHLTFFFFFSWAVYNAMAYCFNMWNNLKKMFSTS